MAQTNFISLLTVYPETTAQGVGPNDTQGGGTVSTGAEWTASELAGDAYQMSHIPNSLSLESFQVTSITAERARQRIHEVDYRVVAMSNIEFGFSGYMAGRGSALADGSTATATSDTQWMEHCMGGAHYAATRTLTGGPHTTTIVTVDSAATIVVGCCVAWLDPDTGLAHPRQVTAVSGTDITLDMALPSTPADDDLLLGGVTLFCDESVLCDTSGTLGSTVSVAVQKGANGAVGWEANGAKGEMSSLTFERNGFGVAEYTVRAARFTPPPSGPNPTLPVAAFANPVSIGPDTQLMVSNTGTTTEGEVCNGTLTIAPGLPVVPVECMTARDGDMPGVGFYTTEPADTIIDLNLFPYDTQWFTDFDAATGKKLSLNRLGASGSCFSIRFPNCEQFDGPVRGGDSVADNIIKLRALEADPTGATAIERSKFVIFVG